MYFRQSTPTNAIGDEIVRSMLDRYSPRGLAADKFALTLLLHDNNGDHIFGAGATPPLSYSYRGDVFFYPCSVIKVFYLVAAQDALEKGRIVETPELWRAMHDMIKWSSNTATNYIIDILTGTTGDTDLAPEAFASWAAARGTINAYFQSLGLPEFEGINVCQKLMDDDRYGREKMFVQLGGNNHNRLTTNAAASMMARIMDGAMISPERSRIMTDFLYRPHDAAFVETPTAQVLNYMGDGVPSDAELWSKAGSTAWTGDPLASYRRHDAIHVALPGGRRFTFVVFTEGKEISADMTLMPFVGKRAAELVAAM
jgi:beta-lactamase class A